MPKKNTGKTARCGQLEHPLENPTVLLIFRRAGERRKIWLSASHARSLRLDNDCPVALATSAATPVLSSL